MEKDFKKLMYESLFGGSGTMTMAQFRSAFKSVVEHILQFEKRMIEKIDSKIRGVDGKDGSNGKNGRDGYDGKDGRDGERGFPGIPGAVGPAGAPDTGEQITRKINHDKSDLLIRKGKVEGLDEIEKMARTADANSRSFMNTGSYVYAQDISDQLNGVLKTFTLVSNAKVILAFGSSAPGVFRPTTDYTTTGSTITFTSEIAAASTLATGQTVIILYKLV